MRLTLKLRIGNKLGNTKAKFVCDLIPGDAVLITLPLNDLASSRYGSSVIRFSMKNCRTGDIIHATPEKLWKLKLCFEFEEIN